MANDRLTLLELNRLVREVIETEMPREYWVEAELSECRESRGHCYMELTERDEHSATPVARAQAKCWASKWMLIRPYFERTTGQALRAGMKVLLKVYAQFHEAYGFSWIVTDIDPAYTLGDQARRRQEIIRQLKAEGVFDMQRELELPLFCLRIAVISSQTAAGYGDFAAQLADSPFAFRSRLFPAIMQGEGVEQSIIAALNAIYRELSASADGNDAFDCVVIIRGGGAVSDMSGFDTLPLAENVAQFPLPIITGIGHDRDESILDMVSHLRVKTPTAAAALLIDHAQQTLNAVEGAGNRIARHAQQRMTMLSAQLASLSAAIPQLFAVVRTRQEARLSQLFSRMALAAQQKLSLMHQRLTTMETSLPLMGAKRLAAEQHRIALLSEKLRALDPQLLLSRGYSITMLNGRALRNPADVKAGDQIETRLAEGTIRSTVDFPNIKTPK
jgi:exodeoxyribonuclease VII large subunit